MRGFYSAPTGTPHFGCIVLATHGQTLYLHSPTNPNEALEDAGGLLEADTWAEFKAALTVGPRNKVFRKRVKRTEMVDGKSVTRTLTVPRTQAKQGDTVEADWLPYHKFMGDPEPEPVP